MLVGSSWGEIRGVQPQWSIWWLCICCQSLWTANN